jgi:hypothetical protein
MDDRYERAGAFLPGLVGESQKRERWLMGLSSVLALALIGLWFRSGSQLAQCKAEKQSGYVVVLDSSGDRLNVPTMNAAEWRLSDPMVVKRLADVVSCLRGLDAVPAKTKHCWEEYTPLFYGNDAVTSFMAYTRERAPTTDAILNQWRQETVDAKVDSYTKPDAEVPGRYWLHWIETHNLRNGQKRTEAWAGTFDVELEPIDKASVNSGLHIVRFSWAKALKSGEG